MIALTHVKELLAGAALLLATALPAAAVVDIQQVETPAGYTAWLSEENNLPFVALEIWFRGGTSLDLPDARGAVNLMTGLLEEGAGDLDSQGFANARDDLAASIHFDSGDDSLAVSARFLTETADEVADLINLALTRPQFGDIALERVRGQVLSGLRSAAEDPDSIADDSFASRIYGDHPYATNGRGTLQSVAALTRDDIVSAFEGSIAADRVHIAAAGDIGAEDLAALIDRILAGIPETGRPLPGRADPDFGGGVVVVPFETPQSVIRFGQPGIGMDHPDFFTAFVLNQILGGGSFDARLMEEVRETRGLAYGAYAHLVNKDFASLHLGATATANPRAAETVQVIRNEWRRMAEEGPTAEELDRAKTYLTGAYPLRFDGNVAIASILAGMQMKGLPPDYVTTRNAKIEAVTMADAQRVAGDFLRPDQLTFLVVGEPEGLTSDN